MDSVLRDLRVPTISGGTLYRPSDTEKTALVLLFCFLQILSVITKSSWAQIRNSVVISHVVYIVNVLIRKRSIDVKPRKSMGVVTLPINTDYFVPMACGFSASNHSIEKTASVNLPSENTSIGIVMQCFAQTLDGKRRIQFSHEALRKLIGQGFEYVGSIFEPRHYTIYREVFL